MRDRRSPGRFPSLRSKVSSRTRTSGRRASAIQVYGVDDRFWAFHGLEAARYRDAGAQRGARQRGAGGRAGRGGRLRRSSMRVEKPSDVPISSLHGRRDDIGRTLRLRIERGCCRRTRSGEFSFRPQQGRARSVFVSLERLQRELEQPGPRQHDCCWRRWPARRTAPAAADRAAGRPLRRPCAMRHLPRRPRAARSCRFERTDAGSAVESAAGLINDDTAAAVGGVGRRHVSGCGWSRCSPILTYALRERQIRLTPYSLVTARALDAVSEVAALIERRLSGRGRSRAGSDGRRWGRGRRCWGRGRRRSERGRRRSADRAERAGRPRISGPSRGRDARRSSTTSGRTRAGSTTRETDVLQVADGGAGRGARGRSTATWPPTIPGSRRPTTSRSGIRLSRSTWG